MSPESFKEGYLAINAALTSLPLPRSYLQRTKRLMENNNCEIYVENPGQAGATAIVYGGPEMAARRRCLRKGTVGYRLYSPECSGSSVKFLSCFCCHNVRATLGPLLLEMAEHVTRTIACFVSRAPTAALGGYWRTKYCPETTARVMGSQRLGGAAVERTRSSAEQEADRDALGSPLRPGIQM
jgi:hypothetical protein